MSPSLEPDQRLERVFGALEPSPRAHARMESRIVADYEVDHGSLLREWLGVFEVGPLRATARTAVAAASLLLLTHLGTALLLARFLV